MNGTCEMRNKTVSGFLWKISERMLAQLISLLISIVLARILSPSDYSVVSIINIFFAFSNILVVSGLNTALIQKKSADTLDYSIVLYTSLLLSIITYGIMFFCAPIIADFYDQPILTPMFRIMGLTLPITAIQSVWSAYISSSMMFRKFFFSTLGGTLISGGVGFYMAVNGCGPWALIAQQMSSIAINTLILIAMTKISIVFKFSLSRFKLLWGFGWKIFLSSIISAIYSETAPLIIGIKFNKNDLSFYTKGRNFPGLISNTVITSLSAVLFPVWSKIQDDKVSLLNYLRKYIKVASFVIFPLMLGFLTVSETFVSVVLTDKWLQTVPYIQIFCVAYMFDMLSSGNCEVLKAMGRSDIFLIIEIIKKSLYFVVIASFVFAMPSAIMLATSSIVCGVIAVIVNSVPNKKLLGYTYKLQLSDIIPNLLNSFIMCVGVSLIALINMDKIILLVIQVFFGALIYILLSLITKNKALFFIISYGKSLLKKT